ncbi:MAG: leucyl aminopeptidase [Rickettsiales bacterium]|nr:leucyl aminopeptidase [Rickettsiales bacterium]
MKKAFDIKFQNLAKKSSNSVFLIGEKLIFSEELKKLDNSHSGIIKKAISDAKFDGKRKKFLSIFLNDKSVSRVILAGIGEDKQKNAEKSVRELGAEIQSHLQDAKISEASIIVEKNIYGLENAEASANIAYGAILKGYNFLKYFTKKKEEEKPSLKALHICSANDKKSAEKFTKLEAIADAVYVARNYVCEPPNVIYPESYANLIKEDFKNLNIKVEILDAKQMQKLGMNTLLGVGQGSSKESRMVIMSYNGSPKKNDAPIAFVGKGVCFDTGGISIKPSDGMEDMKYDMGGSAAVVGAMRSLAGRKAKVNAVGIVGLVENMPDGNAQRPSDVVISMSGQSVEVLNTDAEGRLVLADALWYCQQRFNPKFMIDLATLTGACVIALGQHKAGLLSNDDTLAKQIFEAGEEVSENVWRLPMGDEYDRQIDSKIADVQNISNMKGGGTITAAQFLQRFVNGKKWAHLDIAGVAWATKEKSLVPVNVATGFGVQLLDRLVAKFYEN